MKKLFLLSLLATQLMSVSMQAQTEVAPFRPGVTIDGVNYFLPKTRLRIALVAEKTIVKPGEYAAYANRYLRLNNVPMETSETWTLKELQVTPYGVPDSTKAFNIKLKPKTSAPFVTLTDEGLLLAINAEAEEEGLPALPQPVAAPKLLNGRDYMTQEILAAGSTAKMAQLTAEEIYDIRDSRNALVRGEADNMPKDGAQLRLMLDNLDLQSRALEAMFKGQTVTSTEVMVLDFEPQALDITVPEEEAYTEQRTMLCRFSQRLGLVDNDDLSGEPIWISIKPLGSLPQYQANPESDKRKRKLEQGVRVNIPARAQVTISTSSKELTRMEMPIAQFGTTEILSDILFNKKMSTTVTIHQHTGSVWEVGRAED
ncbi:MAG: DUF4831 family protein [Bacteroidaceae bacterium]|nr:DUF4831 family protein [Bacteroidaceae bacterium]